MTRQEMLDRLLASKLTGIDRSKGTLHLTFNDGEEISLHVHCSWRLLVGHTYRLVRSDIFTQPEGQEYDENFDWDMKGSNRFDCCVTDLEKELPLTVHAVQLSDENDLVIEFDKESLLRVFSNQAQDVEAWCLFDDCSDPPYLVALGRSLEEQL